MKNIDIKSLLIGTLLASTIFLGIAATGPLANGKVKLDGPVDVRLSFGSSKATASNTSTPTEFNPALDTLNVKILAGSSMDNWLWSKHGIDVDVDGVPSRLTVDATLDGKVKTD